MPSLSENLSVDELLDLLPDLVFTKNLEGQYTQCNTAFLEFIQKQKHEVLYKTDFELFIKENAELFTEVDQKILQGGVDKTFEEVFILENKDKAYFNTTKQILRDENNQPNGLFCVARNITLQKQYEIIHSHNQEILEDIAKDEPLDRILEKIVHLAENENSDSFCSILFTDENNEHLLSGIAPSLPDFYNEAINGIGIGDEVGSCGTAAHRRERVIVSNINEHKYWQPYLELTQKANLHACWSQPILSSHENLLGTFAIYNKNPKEPNEFELRLISSFAHLVAVAVEKDNKEKLLQEKNLLVANQFKMASVGEMLENIAHQWRQPLSIISTAASGIQLQKEMNILSDKTFHESIQTVITTTQDLSQTIDDFRDYFKTDKSKAYFSLSQCIEKSIFILKDLLESKNVSLKLDLQDIKLFELENNLIQVLLNIVKNSLDAFILCEQHNNQLFIETYEDNGFVYIKIKDSACGINQSIINKIFEPYFTTKHSFQGTGIGLYMCKDVIEKHMDGLLTVRNVRFDFEEDSFDGAEFTIKLPFTPT